MELVRLEGATYPAWEAREAGRAVGVASLGAGSIPSAWHLRLQVEPGSRRRGIGSLLMATATGAARSAGCQTLETMVVRGSAGERFVARYGAVVGDELIDAVLQMEQVDTARLARFAAGVPDGYLPTRWHDPTPEPLVDSYARAKRVISQAPHWFPPPVPDWTATEVRQAEDRRRTDGPSMWVSAICAMTRWSRSPRW